MATYQTEQTAEQVSLKLLVNKETNKVIFAEAEKDFVDILCSFLTLPLGTIVRLVEKDSNMEPVTIGCLNSLYHSLIDLHEVCFQKETFKDMLLEPQNSSEDYCSTLKLNINGIDSEPTQYFICSKDGRCSSHYLSTSPYKRCTCGCDFSRSVSLKHFCNGFVNGVVTFIITDDLIILPNSVGHTSFSLLQNSGMTSTDSVEEMNVTITNEKLVDLLKCSLLSKSPLTDFFLGKKPSIHWSWSLWNFSYPFGNNNKIQITLNLVIRKSDGKILFAYGEEDFANLLLSFLTFPLGGVISKLGGKYCSLGSIVRLYKSIDDLDVNKYLMSIEAKYRLLSPCVAPIFKLSYQILPTSEPRAFYVHYQPRISDEPGEEYRTSIYRNEFFINHESRETPGFKCKSMSLVNPKSSIECPEGYLKGPKTYLVTDDLVFTVSSPISALILLDRFGTLVSDVKEKVVTIGIKECLSLLNSSLNSTSALTDSLHHLITEDK